MLKMFDALLPYFGGKRRLCPVIFNHMLKHISRDNWSRSDFIDPFMGSGAVSLYAKAQGFRVACNDIAERSYIAGQSLIVNSKTLITDADIERLFVPNDANNHFIENTFCPDVFTRRHAKFLDNAFANANRPRDKYLLIKYIFAIRPYSKFSSPNAFNRPMEEGRFDEIKSTYRQHIIDTLKTPLAILKEEKDKINAGIFSNGQNNTASKMDAAEFVYGMKGGVAYFDCPYANTLSYENEYAVLDKILQDEKPKSKFSEEGGMDMLDAVLKECTQVPLWVISYGNAAGQNKLDRLVNIVDKYRKCDVKEFDYRHCESMATEKHKKQCKEWLIIGYKVIYD